MDSSDTTGDASLVQIPSAHAVFTAPASVSHVVQDNPLHAVSQLHDAEVEEVACAQGSTHQTDPVEPIPRPVPSTAIHHRPTHQYRIFLDICCGIQAPLSAAVRQLSGDILQFDILIHSTDDLLDNQCYESLLRVCASGIVAYAGAFSQLLRIFSFKVEARWTSCFENSRVFARSSRPDQHAVVACPRK